MSIGDFIVSESHVAITTHLRAIGVHPANYAGFSNGPVALCGSALSWDTRLPIESTRCMACMLEAIKSEGLFAKAHPSAAAAFKALLEKAGRL